MSNIWTRCAGVFEIRPLAVEAVRAVEAQHQVSTRKLVDSDAEQAVLETLIEASKPPAVGPARLHYLLSTPFRYPPLRRGSRFGGRHERGLWYGSLRVRTALAEVAYYRLVFLEGTAAALEPLTTQLTTFEASIRTSSGVDLTASPFSAYHADLAAPDRYDATQALGRAMRSAGVIAFRSFSARDAGGENVGVFDPVAFGHRAPKRFESWHCTATRERVEIISRNWFERRAWRFEREAFVVDGRLPVPSL